MRLLKKLFKRKIYLIVILVLFLGGCYWWVRHQTTVDPSIGIYQSDYLKSQFNPETEATAEEEIVSESLPEKYLITNFPFQTQAPFANWDALHEEACEEASIILATYYLKKQVLSAETMEQEIQKLVAWENDNWDGVLDITVEQAGRLAKANYDLNYKAIKNTNITELKKQIAAGNPVIVPAAGRLLGNPNFRGAGPVYHMVVVIGYDEKNIIVQDVGTRNGNHYVYNQKIFYNAWHDWAGTPEVIESGAKNLLILTK